MNRHHKGWLATGALLTAGLTAGAQTVLSDFSSLDSQEPTFLDSWLHLASDNQFVQNSGSISIGPVGGGNPQSDGSFQVGVTLDLNGHAALEVTAREGTGNGTGVFSVVFFNSGPGGVGLGPERGYTFAASDFSGASFTSRSVDLTSPSFSDPSFDPAAVAFWSLEGDYDQTPAQDFRFDYDLLQLIPVPEPASWTLLVTGAGALWLSGRLRRR